MNFDAHFREGGSRFCFSALPDRFSPLPSLFCTEVQNKEKWKCKTKA
jgi:hypothetical protein